MARRFQEITEVYRQEIAALARADRWTAFLRSACRNYKLPFEEQVLVHAQRPDATAVLEIERWNRQFGRWVNKGATGIAVFDRDYPGRTHLKYYFDISDTHESRLSRPVPLWQVPTEQEPDVIEALENRFGALDDSAAYAREHGELEQYRASNNVNRQCKESIEAAVREHFDGMYLSHDAAKGVIETYGMERVSMVLSNTVQLQDWDGRYSRRNKEWAKTIPNNNPEIVRCGYALNSHPAVLDGFIDLVREEQQRSRTQRKKLEPSRPSVRDKLKQELPAHKSAAPKKREPER